MARSVNATLAPTYWQRVNSPSGPNPRAKNTLPYSIIGDIDLLFTSGYVTVVATAQYRQCFAALSVQSGQSVRSAGTSLRQEDSHGTQ